MTTVERGTATRVVIAVTLATASLRVWLALQGGYYFSLDEVQRFHPPLVAADLIWKGRLGEACTALATNVNHVGFHLPGLVVALLGGLLVGDPRHETMPAFAALLSLTAGALYPALGYRLARRWGSSRGEALAACVFLAAAVSLTYFSRHLLSYDSSLAIALLALWLGAGGRHALATGLLATQAWLTYYGYLWPAALAAGFHLWRSRRRVHSALCILTAASLLLGFWEVLVAACAPVEASGWRVPPFHQSFWGQLQTNNENWGSSYAEGWKIPFLYLWGTEGLLLLLWGVLALVAVFQGERRARFWLGASLGLYAALAFQSTVLHRTVVVGRFARSIVPYLVLAAAAGAAGVVRGRSARAVVLGLVVALLAAVNFWPVLTQQFPRDLQLAWARAHPDLAMATTLLGSDPAMPEPPDDARFVAVNVEPTYPWPVTGEKPRPAGRVRWSAPHPLAWAGYRFEGFRDTARAILERQRIWLLERGDPDANPGAGRDASP